jgi:hypothetical protein
MTQQSRFALAALSILATVALAATSAEARPGQGRRPQAPVPAVETIPQVEPPTVTVETPTVTITTPTDELPEAPSANHPTQGESTVDHQNLPPGLQRQVDSGRGLPPGLQRAR